MIVVISLNTYTQATSQSTVVTYMNSHGQRKLWSSFKGNKNNGNKRNVSSAVNSDQYEHG